MRESTKFVLINGSRKNVIAKAMARGIKLSRVTMMARYGDSHRGDWLAYTTAPAYALRNWAEEGRDKLVSLIDYGWA